MNFGNLGIALGAFTDEQKAQAEEARKAKQFSQQEKAWQRQDEVDERLQKAHDFYNSGLQSIEKGEIGAFAPRAVEYLNSTDYMGKAKGAYLQGADGKHYVTYHDGNAYGPPQTHEITPEMARSALADMYRHQLAAADPRQAFANQNAMETMGLKRQEIGVQRYKAEADDRFHQGVIGYHNKQLEAPKYVQVGNRLYQYNAQGDLMGTQDAPWSPSQLAAGGAHGGPKPMAVKVPMQLPNGKTVMETVLVEKAKDGSWINSFTGDKVDPRTFKLNAGEDGPPAMEQVEEKTIGPDGRETTVKYNRPQGAKSGGYQPEKAPAPDKAIDYQKYLDNGDAMLIPNEVLEGFARGRGRDLWKRQVRMDAARKALGLNPNVMPDPTPLKW